MNHAYETIPDDTAIKDAISRFDIQGIIPFFQSKPPVLNTCFYQFQLSQLQSLTFGDDLDLTADVYHLRTGIETLRSRVYRQEDLDNITAVLEATVRYLSKEMVNKEEFITTLQKSGVIMQKHQTYELASYVVAAAIGIGAVALGVAAPYVVLAMVIAAAIVLYAQHHAKDPYRILGDKLFEVFKNREFKKDDNSNMYGF